METAPISLERLASPLVELLDYEGRLYADGWISSEFSFRIRALADIDSMTLKLWNPDFANRYLHNRLTITVGDVTRISPSLYPAQLVTFDHVLELREGRSRDIKIVSEQFCEPDELDQRERGVVFVEAAFAPPARGTGKKS